MGLRVFHSNIFSLTVCSFCGSHFGQQCFGKTKRDPSGLGCMLRRWKNTYIQVLVLTMHEIGVTHY